MKRSQRWWCGLRSQTWYERHRQSEQCRWTTKDIDDLLGLKDMTVTKLLFMYCSQRRLLRGCRGNQLYECSPLKNFPPDEVIGFVKGSGAAGGAGMVGVNGEPQKGSFDDAETRAKMLDEFRFERSHLLGSDDDACAESQQLNTRMLGIKPFSEKLLFGTVFDTNGTEVADALIDRLQRQGAIHFGTTCRRFPYHAVASRTTGWGLEWIGCSCSVLGHELVLRRHKRRRLEPHLCWPAGAFCLLPRRRPDDCTYTAGQRINRERNADVPMTTSDLRRRFYDVLPNETRVGWMSTFAPEFAECEERHAFPGFDASSLPYMPLHPSIDQAMKFAVKNLHMFLDGLKMNRLDIVPLNGSIPEFSHTFLSEWMKSAAKVSKKMTFEKWVEMWAQLWAAVTKRLEDVIADWMWSSDPTQMWDWMWTEMMKEVAREAGQPEVATGTTRVEMPSDVEGTPEAMSKAMSEVMRTQALCFARKRFVASDPHGVSRADFESILAAAEAWSADERMKDSNVYEKRRVAHRRAASELPVDYILSPLLRIPHWKTPGQDRTNPTYTASNTNPAVPFLPTCMGKDAKGEPLEILDPTFNPFCILADVWETPSVTIPLMIWAPHPVEKDTTCPTPYALLLTKVPEKEDTTSRLQRERRVSRCPRMWRERLRRCPRPCQRMRTKALCIARKRFVASDPHGVSRADFESILAAAEAWSADERMKDSNMYEKRRVAHRSAASELPVDYILSPLLRIPHWKTPGQDRTNPTYTASNTNPAVPFLPTCMGKDAKGEPLEILDPTFNPFCILADVWETPSVTIPLMFWAPHPVEKDSTCPTPYALLLTKVPEKEDTTSTETATAKQLKESKATMELLLIAHRLFYFINGHSRDGCEQAYIKELWETEGAPDNVRVTWPEEFDRPNV
ncbi:Hypothetical protein, putative [Bodo saltans]|uniref:Uncharacterized protein n=1 Tax=Bodo saltans TaxID=75058 RepID=A0A0S4JHZ5_BODSA|nr:Hypothetical protein, putative [Bodo saltans]|eukprot:CUG88032.1 Hypothetical protein, putative [Bodo saltans]